MVNTFVLAAIGAVAAAQLSNDTIPVSVEVVAEVTSVAVSVAAAPVSSAVVAAPAASAVTLASAVAAVNRDLEAIMTAIQSAVSRRATTGDITTLFQTLSSSIATLDLTLASATDAEKTALLASFATLFTNLSDTLLVVNGAYSAAISDSVAPSLKVGLTALGANLASIVTQLSSVACTSTILQTALNSASDNLDLVVKTYAVVTASSVLAYSEICPATSVPVAVSTKDPQTLTTVVTAFTTYCPEPTTVCIADRCVTVTEATTVTITDCPCTLTTLVHDTTTSCSTPALVCNHLDCFASTTFCETRTETLCEAKVCATLTKTIYAAAGTTVTVCDTPTPAPVAPVAAPVTPVAAPVTPVAAPTIKASPVVNATKPVAAATKPATAVALANNAQALGVSFFGGVAAILALL